MSKKLRIRTVIEEFVKILRGVLEKNNARNWIYVFMPDHLHLVLEGLVLETDLWKTIKDFKQRTGIWMSKNSGCKWQKDFYDHIHRENENIYHSLAYIINNPVRKGLVNNCLDFKGLGSLDFDINDIVNNIEKSEKE